MIGQAVSGVEVARVRSAACAWNVGRHVLDVTRLGVDEGLGGCKGERWAAETVRR